MNLRDFRKAFTGGAEFRDTTRSTLIGQITTNYTSFTTSFVNTNKTTIKSTLKTTERQTIFPTINLAPYTTFCNNGASTIFELGFWTDDNINCKSGPIPIDPGTCKNVRQYCLAYDTFRQTIIGNTLKGTQASTLKLTPYVVGVATSRLTDVYVDTTYQTLI